MAPSPIPAHESARLEALKRYRILDTLEQREFDDVAALAAAHRAPPPGRVIRSRRGKQWYAETKTDSPSAAASRSAIQFARLPVALRAGRGVRHRRMCDWSIQMSLASGFISERITNAKSLRLET